MKAPAFAYARPARLPEVYALLDAHHDGAKLLAGGQSLMPALNMRIAAPAMLIDINDLSALAGITRTADRLRIGALTRHVTVERSIDVAAALPLLTAAMPFVAHVAIRNSGTFGGSIAYADPAAEIPAVAVALDAIIVIGSSRGERRVPACEFFRGLYETALAPEEVVLAVEIAVMPGYRSAFAEIARRHGDYATVGLAVHARPIDDQIHDPRLVFLGCTAAPRRAIHAEQALNARRLDARAIDAAADALAADLDPLADLYHSRATKLHLARVLLRRTLARFNDRSSP